MNITLLKLLPVHHLPQLPVAAVTTLAGFKDLVSSGIGIIIIITFMMAIVLFLTGVFSRGRNPEMSKWCFVSAFLCAIAVAIVSVMFAVGGMGGAVVDPKFN